MKKSILLLLCCIGGSFFLSAQSNNLARVFMVQQDTSAVGDTFTLRVYAAHFNQLDSLSLSLYFRTDLVDWTGFTQPTEPAGSIAVEMQAAGAHGNLLKINWKTSSPQGLTVADSVALLELYFIGLKPTTGSEYLALVNYPVPIHAFNINQQPITVSDSNLDLWKPIVIYPTESIHFMVEDTAVAPGESFCRKIQIVSLDTALLLMQFSMGWDPGIIRLDSVKNLNISNLRFDNFNLMQTAEGKFSMLWLDNNLQGIPFTPGTTIFEACFTALDSIGNTNFQFTQNPTAIEFYGAGEVQLRFYGTAANIAVTDDPFVRPGDTNLDNTVDHFDLLHIGLSYGNSGISRRNASFNWSDQPVGDWEQESQMSQINYKHFDTDGNGLIELLDVQAIESNWGLVTEGRFTDNDQTQIREEGTPLYVKTKTITPEAQTITFDIILGEENDIAENFYGLAFSITYDELLLAGGSNTVTATFDTTWLGKVGEDLLVLQKNNPAESRIDIALVRIDGENRSGFGAISQLHFTIPAFAGEEPVDTIALLDFRIENVRAIDALEMEQPTTPMETTAVVDISTGINDPAIAQKIQIFPNPAQDVLHIRTNDITIEKVALYNVNGQLILQYNNNATTLPIESLETGLYFCKIQTDKGLITKRLMVVR